MPKKSTDRKTYNASKIINEQPEELSESDEQSTIEISKEAKKPRAKQANISVLLEAQPKKAPRRKKEPIEDEYDDDEPEPTRGKVVEAPVKKPMSQAKADAIKKAQQARQLQLKQKRDEDEETKKLIERSYKAEVEASLTKTLLPRYSKKIKKEILEKLKAQKIQELKKQYGYQTESDDGSSSGSDSSSEEEEEVIIKRKKSNKKPTKKVYTTEPETVTKAKPKPVQESKQGILSKFREYGF
jgi:hypothetical protein